MTTEPHRRGHGRSRGWGAGRRPPWWPEDAQWPPRGGPPWGRGGGPPRLVRRLGCLAGCALLLPLGVIGALVWLLLGALGLVGSGTAATAVGATALAVCAAATIALLVALSRLAPPVGALVEAARRVEAGDYSARVPVRGPRRLRSLARAFNSMSARLEAEEGRRQSVLADIAHELRTPLTIIRSQAEAIADGVNPADEEHLAPIVVATRTLEGLADDLRTLTLVEAGGLHLVREPVDAGVLVNETLDAFRAGADVAGVRLKSHLPADPVVLDADPARLRRVLGNLVANAVAHTHQGGTVTVEVSRSAAEVRIAVRDDGDGIPGELLPRIFDRFVKGPESAGSGLGLAIVRDLVEAHGGLVAAESTAGRGTEIQVTLPVTAADG